MSATKCSPCIPCATVRTRIAFLSTATNRSGAKVLMEQPSSQLARQNQVSVPLPIANVVEASNSACSILSPMSGSTDQVRLGSVRASHAHHNRKA
jgi:hypothetical protein